MYELTAGVVGGHTPSAGPTFRLYRVDSQRDTNYYSRGDYHRTAFLPYRMARPDTLRRVLGHPRGLFGPVYGSRWRISRIACTASSNTVTFTCVACPRIVRALSSRIALAVTRGNNWAFAISSSVIDMSIR